MPTGKSRATGKDNLTIGGAGPARGHPWSRPPPAQRTPITCHQPHLDAIAYELNNCPRDTLGYRTPTEAFNHSLLPPIETTRFRRLAQTQVRTER